MTERVVECTECGARFELLGDADIERVGHYCGLTIRHTETPGREPAPVEVVEG